LDKKTFKALWVERNENDTYKRSIITRSLDDLPSGEVLVKVNYSSLNYKDALSASGNRGVTKRYPHTPGIDASGEVVSSDVEEFKVGQLVIVTCYGLGMNTPGGFGEFIRVPASWVLPCPEGLSLYEAMVYGTGGFTAALSVERLLNLGVKPEQGKVLVTGATGGVGSFAVALLAREGFEVVAVSGKSDKEQFLLDLGAQRVLPREKAVGSAQRAILKPQWAGVVDTVGGPILATAIKGVKYGGAVTCCGNAASADLDLTVYPFILRAVSLLGIDAAECAMEMRKRVWLKLAGKWKLPGLESMAVTITLEELDQYIEKILHGRVSGRVILRHTVE